MFISQARRWRWSWVIWFFAAASPLRFIPARADYTILAERQRSFSAGGTTSCALPASLQHEQWGWFHVSVWQRRVCCPLEETRREVGELRVIVAERMRGGVAGRGFNGGVLGGWQMFRSQLVVSNLILHVNKSHSSDFWAALIRPGVISRNLLKNVRSDISMES